MKIANYNVYTINTGTYALDGGAMFSIVPKTIWNRKNPADERNRIDLALRTLLIVGNGHNILVDVGIGDKFSKKNSEIYKINFTENNLISSLKEHGLSAEDITDIILTHLHFDHAGGATYSRNGVLKPTFPNATYYVQHENNVLANNPTIKDIGSYRSENIIPLIKSGKLKTISGSVELFPNISMIISNGHTLGQQLVKISDNDNTLVYCADLIPDTSHLPVHYIMSYDLHPLTIMEEKRTFLEKAAGEDWILFFEHDINVEAARIKKTDEKFEIDTKIKLSELS